MKKLAILSPLVLLATTALAQDSTCILQPSCSQLGYTSAEADCGTAKVLRCPFDVSQVACLSGGSDGGSGGETGGEPSDEFGTVDNSSCQVGYIYYSDDTCSPEYNYFKDPIGIVFDANRRYIVGFTRAWQKKWSTATSTSVNIPFATDKITQMRDFSGASHTKAIEDLNTLSSYPSAKHCIEKTTGNKEWFLPSSGQMYVLASVYTLVNEQFRKIETGSHSTIQPALFYATEEDSDGDIYYVRYWTSTLYSDSQAVYIELNPTSLSNASLTSYAAGGTFMHHFYAHCIAEY